MNDTKEILKEEKEILSELKQEEKALKKLSRNAWLLTGPVVLVAVGGAFTFAYLRITGARIYTDAALVSAPLVNLAPEHAGILQSTTVHEGDTVLANAVVAQVGNELIKTKTAGVISTVNTNVGKLFNPGETVVVMYDPTSLRVVGKVDEDKGLADIRVGQTAEFTVDAFGSKTYAGVVDEISPSAHTGDIVFNISDQRQVQQFDVKIRYNTDAYPELKNGMSAKIWIYK